jgi:hypothetical protein
MKFKQFLNDNKTLLFDEYVTISLSVSKHLRVNLIIGCWIFKYKEKFRIIRI